MRAVAGMLVGVLCMGAAFCRAQEGEPYRFTYLTMADGLSDVAMTGVVQDHQGFMWFGTRLGGLNRYDGSEFKVYRHDEQDARSLSENQVTAMFLDREGVLWVGTSGGLSRYDRATDDFTQYCQVAGESGGLANSIVNAICEDGSGGLWVGTDGGLCRLNRVTGRFVTFRHDGDDPGSLSQDRVTAVLFDGSVGRLWVGTEAGLCVLDGARGKFKVYRYDANDPRSLAGDGVLSLLMDRAGTVWVGTSLGLSRFVPETETFVNYRHDPADEGSLSNDWVWWLYEDRQGRFWVCTPIGLNLMDRREERFRRFVKVPSDPESLNSSSIYRILQDDTGALWAMANDEGINRCTGRAGKFTVLRHNSSGGDSLVYNFVLGLQVDSSDRLWVGTMDGLDYLEGGRAPIHHVRFPDGKVAAVHAVVEGKDGGYWIGAFPQGLYWFKDGVVTACPADPQDPRRPASNNIWSMVSDDRGDLWIVYWANGVGHYDGQVFKHFMAEPGDPRSLPNNVIYGCAKDREGVIWFGGDGGLTRLDAEGSVFTTYLIEPEEPGGQVNRICSVYADREDPGEIWVGTLWGLYEFDRERQEYVSHYTKRDGLPDDGILAIQRDRQGCLWLGTTGGLSRFDPAEGSFRNYDVSDGLPADKCFYGAAARSSDGQVFFGTPEGLVAFYPDKMEDNPYPPAVVLTGFELFNKPVPIGGEGSPLKQAINVAESIVLEHEQSVFTFKFAGLNYTAPEKNRYAYKMEGFDDDWRYTDFSRRFATYTNLNAGVYRFRVRASNNDGIWNEEGAAIEVRILPPWWATWWSRALAAVSLVGLVLGGYRWRLSAITRRAAELEEQVSQRTRSLSERTGQLAALAIQLTTAEDRERRHLAEVLHEDLQQMLVALQFQLDVMERNARGRAPAPEMFKRAASLLQACVEKTRTLSHELSPPTLRQLGLVAALEWQAERMRNQHGLAVEMHVEGEVEPATEVLRALVYRAVAELLFNVVKHAGVRRAVVRLRRELGNLEVTVEDAGKGFDPAGVWSGGSPRGYGLLAIRERLLQLGGRLEVYSRPGEGSRFVLQVPEGQWCSGERVEGERGGRREVAAGVSEDWPGDGVAVSTTTVRVLLADDHRNVREGLSRLLEQEAGLEVVGEADNGRQAVDMVKEVCPDVVLMDVSMPVMSGVDATRLIKREFPAVRVVALSMFDQEDLARSMLEAGAEAYLCKSGPTEDLVSAIRGH